MYQTSSGISRILVIIADCICIVCTLVLASYLRNGRMLVPSGSRIGFGVLLVIALLVYLFLTLFRRFYDGFFIRGFMMEVWSTVMMNIILVLGITVILFFIKASEVYSRIVIMTFAIMDMVLMILVHTMLKKLLPYFYRSLITQSNVLVVGEHDFAGKVMEGLVDKQNYATNPIGVILTDGSSDESILGVPVVARTEELADYCLNNQVDEVIVKVDKTEKEVLIPLLDQVSCGGIVIRYMLGMPEFTGAPFQAVIKDGGYYLATYANSSASSVKLAVKRIFDVFAGLLGSIFTVLLMLIIGPAIKLESKGPVFFKQQRIGKNGRIFWIYKFRSMYIDAEERKKELMRQNEMDGFMFKMEDDPRITKVGKFIRKTSIDEFPQFFNILKGDMSMVGTRPPTMDEFSKYNLNQKSRLSFRPGLTGLWQVSGRNDITDFEDVVRLDTEYIRNWSLSEDVVIMLKTVPAMISGK